MTALPERAPGFSTLIRRGGVLAILSGLVFFVGVLLQFAAGWFPDEALRAGEMGAWLDTVSRARATALAGIGCSIVAIALWMTVGLVLRRLLGDAQPFLVSLAWAGYLSGVPLALAAFTFAFGATWGLADAAGTASAALAIVAMRGFLVMDDVATFLIAGVGNGFFSLAAHRSGRLPRWLTVWGMVAAVLVTLVLLRYPFPVFTAATVAYPLVLLWFVLAGVVLLRRGPE